MRLENESGTLGLLVTTKLEVLASLEGELKNVSCVMTFGWKDSYLCLGLALCAL
jgi:predicted histidine transporter YuiF (NhaC family)